MEPNVIDDVAMVDGVISIPGMTREDILERDWNHPGLNSIRTMLGINNNSTSGKRERLIVDEINVNNDYTDINIDMRLHERQLFCERVNELFGLNISVKKRFEDVDKEVDNDEVQDAESTDENS